MLGLGGGALTTASDSNGASRSRADLRERAEGLLVDGSEADYLRRLLEGDPLGLWERCARHLAAAALLLEAELLFERTAARIAHLASQRPEQGGDFERWIDARMHEAVRELSRAQLLDEARRVPLSEALDGPYYQRFAQVLHCTPEEARFLCLTFNALPPARRLPFYHVVVCGQPMEDYARRQGQPSREVYRAIDAVMQDLAEAVEDRNWKREREARDCESEGESR